MRVVSGFRYFLQCAALIASASAAFCADMTVSNRVEAASVPVFGRLETVRIVLEQLDENVALRPQDLKAPRWYFPGMTMEQVSEALKIAGLSAEQQNALSKPEAVHEEAGGVMLLPPKTVVSGLSRDVRTALYAKLAEFPENERQRQPFQFLEADIEEWKESGVLSSGTAEMVRQLSFSRAGMLCLADTQMAGDIPFFERGAFMKVLTRVPSLVVKVNIDRNTDIDAMAGYWGAGGRSNEVRVVLQASSDVEGGSKMDLTRILPPFVRNRLFTYPDLGREATAAYQDCFWTALNFFNTTPKDFFGDPSKTGAWVAANYDQVKGEPRYGDVIMMMDPGGTAIHACVYLADKIVFTKNGKGLNKPWILMNMDEMFRTYLAQIRPGTRLQVLAFRLKGS